MYYNTYIAIYNLFFPLKMSDFENDPSIIKFKI